MRAAVVGFGKSGKSAYKLLKEFYNIDNIAVFDDKNENFPKISSLNQEEYELIVVSPGIDIGKYDFDKKKIVSEYELAFNLVREKKFIGVTGSNGKSTVTHFIAEIFKKLGKKSVACGNIGFAFGEAIVRDYEVYSVEFSSFQIDLMKDGEYLDCAVILNITEDHLDRYKTFENYKNSKIRFANLLKNGSPLIIGSSIRDYFRDYEGELIVVDEDLKLFPKMKGNLLDFGEFFVNLDRFEVYGKHNIVNLAFALCAVSHFEELEGDCTSLINGLKGLKHRCEIVGKKEGVLFVNDSKATNVDSTMAALKGLDGNIILLLGGYDKGGNFSVLSKLIEDKCKKVILFGSSAKSIEKQLSHVREKTVCETMKDAFDEAVECAKRGDTVLLSPACASFDEFENFEKRGEFFKELVKGL